MGCDIHLYLEYSKKETTTEKRWSDFGGRINPGRNYLMFGIMAEGVRCEPTFSFPQKGIPDDCAYASRNDNLCYISEHEGDNNVTMEKAKGWVERGSSEFVLNQDGETPTWVTNPDWHSHSWLTTEEFQKALDFYNANGEPKWILPEYEAILASMKRLEELGYDARIIFWFDN